MGSDGVLKLGGLRRRHGAGAGRQASAGTAAIEVSHLTKDFKPGNPELASAAPSDPTTARGLHPADDPRLR
jgi:hypothetical protein